MNNPAAPEHRPRGFLIVLRELGWSNVVAGLLLVAGLAAAALSLYLVQRARNVVDGQNQVLAAAEQLISTLKDLETGERGYALTGDAAYLEPYDSARAALGTRIAVLDAGASEVGNLTALVQVKQDFARRVVAVRHDAGLDAAITLVRSGEDKASMDNVRAAVATLEDSARARIARSDREEALRGPLLEVLAAVLILPRSRPSRCRHCAAAAPSAPARPCSAACWTTPRSASACSTRSCTCATSTRRCWR